MISLLERDRSSVVVEQKLGEGLSEMVIERDALELRRIAPHGVGDLFGVVLHRAHVHERSVLLRVLPRDGVEDVVHQRGAGLVVRGDDAAEVRRR